MLLEGLIFAGVLLYIPRRKQDVIMILERNKIESSSMTKIDAAFGELEHKKKADVVPSLAPSGAVDLLPAEAPHPGKVTKEAKLSSDAIPKPFFIMDWLDQVDPADLERAQRMLKTPRNQKGSIGDDHRPLFDFSSPIPSSREEKLEVDNLQSVSKDLFPETRSRDKTESSPGAQDSYFRRRSIAVGNGWNAKGLAKAKQGLWADALLCWENALAVRTQVLGCMHVDVANTYNNMGIAQGKLSNSQLAMTHLQRALQIRQQQYGKRHPEIAATLHNIGNVLQQSGELEGAIAYFCRAKDMQCDLLGAEHVQVARASRAIGHAYYQDKRYEAAHHAYCDALTVLVKLQRSGVEYADEIEATQADVQELEGLICREKASPQIAS